MKDKPFRTVGIFDKGYDIEEVDDFLRRAKDAYNGPLTPAFDENTVRNAAFSRARGGYVPAEIDDALDRLSDYFDGKTDLSAREVREAVFGSAKDNHAYDESVVDVYLERAASVLLSVE